VRREKSKGKRGRAREKGSGERKSESESDRESGLRERASERKCVPVAPCAIATGAPSL